MNAPILIVGTGGFAIELADIIIAGGGTVAGFIGPREIAEPWLGEDDVLASAVPGAQVLIAVGAPELRAKLMAKAEAAGRTLAVFISPKAFVAASATIGAGSMIYPNATVHARITLGAGVLVNSNASIGHETRVGDCVNVGPGVALGGRCTIGAGSYLGIGCSTLEGLTLAPGTIVGAGAAVLRDTSKSGTYVGVPARRLDP